ncbi:MAG: agmatinase [Gammaproteobacteria bacterium]|nr:agmatinase [Gammaproteobacteria bacterium]
MVKLGQLFGDTPDGETPSFLGFERCSDLNTLVADIALIGIPIATPYASLGTYAAGSPTAIRIGAGDFVSAVNHFDFDLGGPVLGDGGIKALDCGDLDGDVQDAAGNRERITKAMRTILDRGAIPIVLGGDDSVPIPIFQAFEGRGDFTVLQVDAHIDWRDEVGGERYGLSSTMRRASEMPWVKRIVQVGARGIGSARPQDFDDARAWGAHIIPAQTLHADGVSSALKLIPDGSEVLVTIDCDGLDPAIMPAVIGPAPGGLSYWQVVALLQGVAAKARIACFDIVEFMTERDAQGLAALTAARLVCNAIGLIARQRWKA